MFTSIHTISHFVVIHKDFDNYYKTNHPLQRNKDIPEHVSHSLS